MFTCLHYEPKEILRDQILPSKSSSHSISLCPTRVFVRLSSVCVSNFSTIPSPLLTNTQAREARLLNKFIMAAWIPVPTSICSGIKSKLEIIRPTHNKPMLLPLERLTICEDVLLHRESVTVDCGNDAIKGLLTLMALEKKSEVRTAISPHGAEMSKLAIVFPNLNNFAQYTGMSDELKDRILIREAVIQERDCLAVSGAIARTTEEFFLKFYLSRSLGTVY